MEPLIRPASDADIDVLLELMREYYEYDGHRFESAGARKALAELLVAEPFGRVWLICDGTRVAGYIALTFGFSLEFRGRDAFVDELFLREEYRGRGWGWKALRHAEEEARKRGVRALHLEVAETNERGQDLYRRFGFEDRSHRLMTKRL